MATNFTEQQLKAINSRYDRLIVSAAAGSGKTAVLVERVIGIICDEETPGDIENLVVVTFTNAAAAEMRAKIAAALLNRLTQNPENTRMKRQLALLSGAKIQTVHSFCLDLVRQNFAKCGIAADFTLGDEVECAMLMQTAIDELLEEKYEQNSDGFAQLCEGINEERGDRRLCETVFEIYKKLRSHPNPEKWLEMVGSGLTEQSGLCPEHTGWGSFMINCANDVMKYAIKNLRDAYEILKSDANIFSSYGAAFEYCIDVCHKWELGGDDWDKLFEVLQNYENPALTAVRKGNKELAKQLGECKKQFGAAIETVYTKYICASGKQIAKEMELSRPIIEQICILVSDFSRLYAEKKRARNILDFADLEHMALSLLVDENGAPTQLAESIANEISEILVDEYQDTNEIQDAIFNAIKPKHGGLFMVGDVKQSIYRFRLANPDIFVDKYMSYEDFDKGSSPNKRLSLNKNFRSDGSVLELCNYVFSRTMSRRFGDIDYTEQERLYQGISFEESTQSEFYVLDMLDSRDDAESPKVAQAEGKLVAGRLNELLKSMNILDKDSKQMRKARPSDFVILLSSFRNKAPIYAKELLQLGIPVAASGGSNMLDTIEIQVMLSYLRIIDNRRQDVPLISVLRSPLYLFSPDELGEIRLHDTEHDMLDGLIAAAPAMAKAQAFLDDLNQFIEAAQDCDTGQLLQMIYAKTGARGVFSALDGGEERRMNLDKLLSMAQAFDGSAAKGLYAFLRYIDKIIEDGGGIEVTPQAVDAVQIMSIHKSKGLEYPVVFIPDLAKAFNVDDLKKPVLFHQHMGIGIKLRDSEKRLEFKTQIYQAIQARSKRELCSEELRKLYVAMTRAKQKLVLSITLSNAEKKLTQWAAVAENPVLPPEVLAEQNSAAMWICASLLSHPGAGELRDMCGSNNIAVGKDGHAENLIARVIHYTNITDSINTPDEELEKSSLSLDIFAPMLAKTKLEYSHQEAAKLPSKLTPTGARRLLPQSAEIEQEQSKAVVKLYGNPIKAAARGTAMHRFLECADYKSCVAQGCESQLLQLTQLELLTEEQAGLIDIQKLNRFFKSPLAKRIVNADSFTREYEFSALFAPSEVGISGVEDEDILMNGTIDLLLFEGDSATIVDFKTDKILPGGEPKQAEKYRLQLDIYGKAVEKIFEKSVKDKVICFLHTGEALKI